MNCRKHAVHHRKKRPEIKLREYERLSRIEIEYGNKKFVHVRQKNPRESIKHLRIDNHFLKKI
jgi:hypothetical protein